MKIRVGDSVVVISGKDKGKTGQVMRVLPSKNRVVVSDSNIRTKHVRGGPNRPGEIVKYEASIDASNVMILDPKTKKRSRIGYKIEKGKKSRIAKASGEVVKKGTVAKKKESTKDSKEIKEIKDNKDQRGSTDPQSKKKNKEIKDKKSPFWKKMGFGEQELGDAAEVDTGSHMQEDHSVPSQTERQSTRSSGRGS